MPQRGANSAGRQHKKKKGRAPAHQNKFAFKHNPKSKKTDKILSSPNVGVCRRCHEKIEWRKKYRKYKPRTQPGKCNLCSRRTVLAAYHTICGDCAGSDRAFAAATLHPADNDPPVSTELSAAEAEAGPSPELDAPGRDEEGSERSVAGPTPDHEDEPQEAVGVDDTTPQLTQTDMRPTRNSNIKMCAICVKEQAMQDPSADVTELLLEEQLARETGRIKLRERRAMERKIERAREEKKQAEKEAKRALSSQVTEVDEGGTLKDEDEETDAAAEKGVNFWQEEVEEDDFLKAVGGPNKLLTGEAYQSMLLAKERQTK